MSEEEPQAPVQHGWDTIYALYRDPPDHEYQAIEVKEHLPSGMVLLKMYGGRGDGEWGVYVIPADERDRLADAIRRGPNDD